MKQLDSYIQDTNNFLRKIEEWNEREIPPETVFGKMDVHSLYTNINQGEEIRACIKQYETWKDANSNEAKDLPSSAFLEELLKFVLERNYFEFLMEFFLQC